MTLNDAIAVLINIAPLTQPGNLHREHEAIELGIEALKRCRANNRTPQQADCRPLLSETKE